METDDLLRRVRERLNHSSNPSLPPEETMKAILALGDERDDKSREAISLSSMLCDRQKKIETLEHEKKDVSARLAELLKKHEDLSFITAEYEACLRRLAGHEYEGKEAITAKRVYDLNKGSCDRRLINCRLYTTIEEARVGYRKYCERIGASFDEINMLPWLYEEVSKEDVAK